jgi:ferric-dicitrate binding protein FerR (iron transport regulator)
VELTVTERVRVTERVIVALVVGDLERLSVTLAVRVNGRVVGIADLLTVRVTERVILTDTVLDTVTDPERVGKLDAGTVYGADGLLVTERVRVSDTVGLMDRVNGQVVGIADLVTVIVTDRLKVSDTVRDTVTELDLVGNADAGIVTWAEGLLVTERVRVSDTVGLMDRVNGRVVGIADRLTVIVIERVILTDTVLDPVTDPDRVPNPDAGIVTWGEGVLVTERVRVRDTVGLMDRVNGRVVGIADRLTVIVIERVILTDTVLDPVTDPDRVGNPDAGIVTWGEGVLVTERVRVRDTVGLMDRVNGRVVGIADPLLVIVTERVILTDTVLDPVTDPDRVPNPDAGIVTWGEGVLVTERVRVSDTVGLTDRVKGWVLGTGDLLLVIVKERVILPETLRVPETDPDLVGNPDAGIVNWGEGVLVTERVRVSETVGLIDRVNGQLVANGLRVPVPHRVTDREPERLTVRVFA